jgi:hypothetical protein
MKNISMMLVLFNFFVFPLFINCMDEIIDSTNGGADLAGKLEAVRQVISQEPAVPVSPISVSIDTKRSLLFLSYYEVTTNGFRMMRFNADLEFNFFTDYYFTMSSSLVNNGFKRPIFLLNQAFTTTPLFFASTTPLFNEPTCVSSSNFIQKYVVNQRNGLTYFLNAVEEVFSMPGTLCDSVYQVFGDSMAVLDIDVSPRSDKVFILGSNFRILSALPTEQAVLFTSDLINPFLIAIDYVHQYFYIVTYMDGLSSVYVLDGFAADENILSIRSVIGLPPFLNECAMAVDAELGLCYILVFSTPALYVVNRDALLGSRTLSDYDVAISLVVDPVSHCVFIAGANIDMHPILTKYCWK